MGKGRPEDEGGLTFRCAGSVRFLGGAGDRPAPAYPSRPVLRFP